MIALITSWIFILIIFSAAGNATILLYRKLTKEHEHYDILDTLLLGMCLLGVIVGITSLFIPSDFKLLLALLIISIIYWVTRRRTLKNGYHFFLSEIKSVSLVFRILIVLAFISILLQALLAPTWVDTSYYHIQNIMWNEQFHVVPGLANLQPRFGFNSNYFLLSAVFGLKPLFGQFIFGINPLFVALIFACLIFKSAKTNNKAASLSCLFMFCVFMFVYKEHISSSSSDLLPNLLILYLIFKILFVPESLHKKPFIYLCIPIFCLTLKASSFIIGLLTLYILWNCIKKKKYKFLTFGLTYGAIILLVWCIRNIIITGYPIFPLPSVDIFSFDWKIPLEYVIDQKNYITAFARVDTSPVQDVLDMSIKQWMPLWWHSGMFYYFPTTNRLLFICGLLSIPSMIVLYFTARNFKYSKIIFSLWLLVFIGFLFWLMTAPDFRFAYGFILPMIFIPIYVIISVLDKKLKFSEKSSRLTIKIICIICSMVACCQSVRMLYYQRDPKEIITQLLLKPEPVSRTKELREYQNGVKINFMLQKVNNVDLYIPNIETHCLDCPLPCGLDYTGGLEMRGKDIQDGFRTKRDAPYRRTY